MIPCFVFPANLWSLISRETGLKAEWSFVLGLRTDQRESGWSLGFYLGFYFAHVVVSTEIPLLKSLSNVGGSI